MLPEVCIYDKTWLSIVLGLTVFCSDFASMATCFVLCMTIDYFVIINVGNVKNFNLVIELLTVEYLVRH